MTDPRKLSIHFAKYTTNLTKEDGSLVGGAVIVLKDHYGHIMKFTDFGRYVKKKKMIGSAQNWGEARFDYVIPFLNYCFFDRYHVESLDEIRPYMIQEYLNEFGRNVDKERLETCCRIILDFFSELIRQTHGACRITEDELYKNEDYRDKKGVMRTRRVPVFRIAYSGTGHQTLRDIPSAAFRILLSVILEKYPSIIMAVAACAFAGCRPSEAVNLYTGDVTNIEMRRVDGRLTFVRFDLRKELDIRGDRCRVGKIKRERLQKVYPAFLPVFDQCFSIHDEYRKGVKRRYNGIEPLSLNHDAKGMTYRDFYNTFNKAVRDAIPMMLSSDDPVVVDYGYTLMTTSISPQILRHFFSCELKRIGETEKGLQYWRGDKSIESSYTYTSGKYDITADLAVVEDEASLFNMWRALKLVEGGVS